MGERGVSSIIVVIVIVAVIAVVAAIGGYYLKTRGRAGGPGGLAVYSGSNGWSVPSEYQGDIPGGVEVAGYSIGNMSVQDILSWYKGQMTAWTLVNEVTAASYGELTTGSLLYRKGDVGADITAISGMGLPGTCYILATGPWPAFGGLENRPVPPSVLLAVTAKDDPAGVLLTLSHEGGDDLVKGDLTVEAINGTASAENTNIGDGTLSVGNRLQVLVDLNVNPNDVITVYIIHKPSKEKIFASSTIVVQTGLSPEQMLSVSAEKYLNNTIKLTISCEGGDDLPIPDIQVLGSDSAGTMQTATLSPSSGTLSVGGTINATYTYSADPSGKLITIYIIHIPSGEKLFVSSTVAVQGTPSPPNALLAVAATEVDATHYTLKISHEGGDDLSVSDLEIMASMDSANDLQTVAFPGTGTFSVGMSTTITCSYSPDVTGQVVTVYIIHNPSHQKIFSSSTVAVQGPTPPSALLSVTAKDNGDNIVVITISHEGGDDLVISDLKIMASDNNGTMETATKIPSSGTLSVGGTMTAYYNYDADSSGAVITVWVIHVPSNQKLFSSSYIAVQILPPPNALLSVTAKRNDTTGLTGYTLTISHEGGDDLSVSDLEIQASDSITTIGTYAFPGLGTFSVGHSTTINCTYTGNVTGQVVTVYIIHKPSKEKIFSSSTVAVQS